MSLDFINTFGKQCRNILNNNPTMSVKDLSEIIETIAITYEENNIDKLQNYYNDLFLKKGWKII